MFLTSRNYNSNILYFQDPLLSTRAGSSPRPLPSGRPAPSHIKAEAAPNPTQSAGHAPGLAEPGAQPALNTQKSVIVSCVVACPPSLSRAAASPLPRPPGHGHPHAPHLLADGLPNTDPATTLGVEVDKSFFLFSQGRYNKIIRKTKGKPSS